MRKTIVFISVLLFFGITLCFAQETLTITTYYPSPYGSYKELSSYRMKIGPTYSTTSMTDADNGKLIVEGPVGIGTTGPTAKMHILQTAAADAFRVDDVAGDTSPFVIDQAGNVGIGTTNPTAKLEVAGGYGPNGISVSGSGGDIGVEGRGDSYGVRGVSSEGVGIFAQSTDTFEASLQAVSFDTNGYAVMGSATGTSWAGYFDGGNGLYGSRIEAGGSQTGATKMVFDIAEDIDAPGCESGDVVVITPDNDRRVVKSSKPYDTTVAGIISENPVFQIGKTEGFKPLALAGQVNCKATTENGPIKRGNLLVTSSKPGYAMKADPDKLRPGMVLGKALEPLEQGEGKIVVLVTLQ